MSEPYDAIIAGAGSIGLWVASEVALTGARVLVLERDTENDSDWKLLPLGLRGVSMQSLETLHRRDMLSRVVENQNNTSKLTFTGHFSGIRFPISRVELERFPYLILGPSVWTTITSLYEFTEVMLGRAKELGVEVRRGHTVVGVDQDENGVTVQTTKTGSPDTKEEFRGKWLVGCDGGRSAVRHFAGFKFEGSEAKGTWYRAQCDIQNSDKLSRGMVPGNGGLYARLSDLIPQKDLPNMRLPGETLVFVDFDGGAYDRSGELTHEHLQSVFERISGDPSIKITKVYVSHTFTDRSKQATSYRQDRVLLAGDACHIHPPVGGQGLNLGIGDAMNLGWKLGAVIRAEKQSGGRVTPSQLALLDSYEKERRPVGEQLLEYTRAQTAVLVPDAHGNAMYNIIKDVIENTTEGLHYFVARSWGLQIHYDVSDAGSATDLAAKPHPLAGRTAPDFEFEDGIRLGPKLKSGNGLIVDFGRNEKLRELIDEGKFEDRIHYLALGAKKTCGLGALIVRPDGFVAWAVDEGKEVDLDAAKKALGKWFI
ncbi:putative pentachlorophenol 4-monooxygenase [Xylariaceae sp. FL0255]|nr:putative pentachlorophenol 4-monooxygenase [Xylariaceae sp. FL0255]